MEGPAGRDEQGRQGWWLGQVTPSTTASKVEPVVESKTHSTESREATGTSKVPASSRGSHTHRVGAGGEEESFSFPYPPLPLRPKEDLGRRGWGRC